MVSNYALNSLLQRIDQKPVVCTLISAEQLLLCFIIWKRCSIIAKKAFDFDVSQILKWFYLNYASEIFHLGLNRKLKTCAFFESKACYK